VAAANLAALREPSRSLYTGAVQVYPWVEGALYRLYTAPERVSDVALQAGEGLISVAAGDTVRWVIGDTTSGAGSSRRVHILVKPSGPGLSTNLLVTTDRRTYHIQLESSAAGAMASIAWSYAEDALLAVRRDADRLETAAEPEPAALERLNFGYRIEGDKVPWRPVRAFDDGRQVFIEIPPARGGGEAPPLFVLGEDGAAQLVNYRLRGRFYVVDRLFAAAELRLGEKKPKIVRILREGARVPRGRREKSS
jgi:type IV secretion system protein VirB9